MSKSYPEQHLDFIKMRCNAKMDEYGRMTGSETKYAFYKQLVDDLVTDKYSRKQRLHTGSDLVKVPYLKEKDPLSDELLKKVERVVDILFKLSIEDMFIVEKSYLLLDEIVHFAKDEGSRETVAYFDKNPEMFNYLSEFTYSYLSPTDGHFRRMTGNHNIYATEQLFLIPTALACLPVLEELFQKDHERLVDYCRKYRHDSYVEIENHRALEDL